MAGKVVQRKLLVEGESDKRVIPELVEHNGILWAVNKGEYVVTIASLNGVDNFHEALLNTELKASGLEILGLIVDADDDPLARWVKIRDICRKTALHPSIPDDLPPGGLVIPPERSGDIVQRPGFGLWMMPDNRQEGMLETFLTLLVPDHTTDPVWRYVKVAVDKARNKGAPFIREHSYKARLHTWLAWQKPPGRQLHEAIRDKVLDPKAPESKPFMEWFRALYNL